MESLISRIRLFLLVMITITVFGIISLIQVEGWAVLDAIYFSVVTMTTVGYGDIHPVTNAGKILVMVMIIGGVGTFTGLVATTTEHILHRREKKQRTLKLNMVIGLFFSEVGTELLARFVEIDPRADLHRQELSLKDQWSEETLIRAAGLAQKHEFRVDLSRMDLVEVRSFLKANRPLLLRLLEHPTLVEHELFSDLLLAVFHLLEELAHRRHLRQCSDADMKHLTVDSERVYGFLIVQWFKYMRHLKVAYPYLFMLAARRNPLLGRTTVEIE
ncbi:MAG: two pore domain potassium channel family protein [Deltaproteobacteria bacterium]|nr:two pore domain potassium channel family protein [Deltaproteobacteria bacterium]